MLEGTLRARKDRLRPRPVELEDLRQRDFPLPKAVLSTHLQVHVLHGRLGSGKILAKEVQLADGALLGQRRGVVVGHMQILLLSSLCGRPSSPLLPSSSTLYSFAVGGTSNTAAPESLAVLPLLSASNSRRKAFSSASRASEVSCATKRRRSGCTAKPKRYPVTSPYSGRATGSSGTCSWSCTVHPWPLALWLHAKAASLKAEKLLGAAQTSTCVAVDTAEGSPSSFSSRLWRAAQSRPPLVLLARHESAELRQAKVSRNSERNRILWRSRCLGDVATLCDGVCKILKYLNTSGTKGSVEGPQIPQFTAQLSTHLGAVASASSVI
eukprot:scaffold529_cov308-Pinguiococcus_pyrenoidosus.AAC.33